MPNIDELLVPQHCVSNNLQKTARAVSRLYAETMRPAGLTRAQFPILSMLNALGSLPMTVLADRLYMERTTLTRHLRPLEEAGFIDRPKSPEDARVRMVAISTAGRLKLEEARRLWKTAQTLMIERFGAEAWQQLEGALRTLRHLTR